MSTLRLQLCGLALVAVIGAIDMLTGSEISVSILYLIPIALVSWNAEKPAGYTLSVASAMTWFAIDFFLNASYSEQWISGWNAVVRLAFFLLVAYLLSTLKTYFAREYALLRIDALTGAKNSQAFRDEARFLLRLAARHKHSTVLACLDLDNFKQVNDTMGEAQGDRILQTIVMALTLSGRSTDVVGRLGGDEFAILLPETDLAGARLAFEKLHDRILKITSDRGWPIGLSIGVAVFPEAPPNVVDALKYADSLLNRVKQENRGEIVYEVFTGGQANARGVVNQSVAE
jgi:diguanylate cyclase (GGDEF)-like protein